MTKDVEKAIAVGINHVALEVDDIDAALSFYSQLMTFSLRGRSGKMAFIDLGDQFLNLSVNPNRTPDTKRHFGLVVKNREAMRKVVVHLECEMLPSSQPTGLDFLDPWGNHIQVVEYAEVQFSKTPEVLRFLGLDGEKKSRKVLEELAEKGISTEGIS